MGAAAHASVENEAEKAGQGLQAHAASADCGLSGVQHLPFL